MAGLLALVRRFTRCCAAPNDSSASDEERPQTVVQRTLAPAKSPSNGSAVSARTVELTIPPTPAGPFEEAEKRMRASPKYRKNETVHMRYGLTKILGAGGFAIVKLAIEKSTGKKYACKIITLPKNDKVPKDEVTRSEVFHEVEIASGANHRNIITVKEFFISEKRVSLIMDFLEGGMVLDSLLDRKHGRYTEDDARGVMKQVLQGLEYLHARNVAHRDLKLENILLARKDDLSCVKIVDFGLSKHTEGMMSSVLGTPQFVSPEMLSRNVKTYGKYVDMWSAGVLLYIFLSGFPPFSDQNEQALFKKIMAGHYTFKDPVWNSISDSGKDLINRLLVKDVNVRYSATEALAHEWFSNLEEFNEPLQETRSNLLRLKRSRLMQKAGRVVVALNRMQLTRTEQNIQDMATQLFMEDMRLPTFILEESEEDTCA